MTLEATRSTATRFPRPANVLRFSTGLARASARDLALVIGLAAATFAAGSWFDLHEVFSRWASGYEHWQLDELPATLFVLALGFGWFAFRRWRDVHREIEGRRRIERETRLLLGRNRELAQQLIGVQEAERHALARELHDELGQRCNAIRVEAACILMALDRESSPNHAVADSARRIVGGTEALYQLVHDMLRRLRPALLDSLGLVAALQALCESWEERAGIDCRFLPADVPERLDERLNIAIFRTVQEGLSNVWRHSGATRVDITLQRQTPRRFAAEQLALTIADNGRGFPAESRAGLGLVGMRERVAALGGEMALASTLDRGARLEVTLPLLIAFER